MIAEAVSILSGACAPLWQPTYQHTMDHDNYRKPAILLTFQESEVCLRMMSKLGGICKERLAKRQNGNIKSILQPRCLYFVCDAHFFAVLEMNTFELWAQTQHVCLNLQKRSWFCFACHQFISVESWRIARYCKILQVQVLCLVFIEYSRKCVIPLQYLKNMTSGPVLQAFMVEVMKCILWIASKTRFIRLCTERTKFVTKAE